MRSPALACVVTARQVYRPWWLPAGPSLEALYRYRNLPKAVAETRASHKYTDTDADTDKCSGRDKCTNVGAAVARDAVRLCGEWGTRNRCKRGKMA